MTIGSEPDEIANLTSKATAQTEPGGSRTKQIIGKIITAESVKLEGGISANIM